MSQLHDLQRQVNYLQQCLSQDKRHIGFFIAAGCSLSIRIAVGKATEPLIPDVAGLTSLVASQLNQHATLKKSFSKLHQNLTDDGVSGINVEHYLSFIRGLRTIAGATAVRGLSPTDLADLEGAICQVIVNRVDRNLPEEANGFSSLAAWIASASRSCAVEIFTTNYDLLIEQALEKFRIPFFDGFSGSHMAFLDTHSIDHDDKLPGWWARLWKLHGSINWTLDGNNQVRRTSSSPNSHVIHPSHLKYDESRRMPYLAMIDRLRSFIRKPASVLIVSGYSFNDEHLNACMLEGLSGSPRSAVFALVYGKLDSYPKARRLAETAANLSVLAEDGAVIGAQAAPWQSRDQATDSLFPEAIEWRDKTKDSKRQVPNFQLGDFAKLGRFLSAIVGTESK